MFLYVDGENKVRAVNNPADPLLTPLYVDEEDETFPFSGWSTAKICCFKVTVNSGIVVSYSPYIDSRNLEMIDLLGHKLDNQYVGINENSDGLLDVAGLSDENSTAIEELAGMFENLAERVEKLEEG